MESHLKMSFLPGRPIVCFIEPAKPAISPMRAWTRALDGSLSALSTPWLPIPRQAHRVEPVPPTAKANSIRTWAEATATRPKKKQGNPAPDCDLRVLIYWYYCSQVTFQELQTQDEASPQFCGGVFLTTPPLHATLESTSKAPLRTSPSDVHGLTGCGSAKRTRSMNAAFAAPFPRQVVAEDGPTVWIPAHGDLRDHV